MLRCFLVGVCVVGTLLFGQLASGQDSNNNYLQKWDTASGDNLVDSVCYEDGSGNIGISDSTPSYKLDVNGDFRADGVRTNSGDNYPNFIGGASSNTISTSIDGGGICGGRSNIVSHDYSFVGGGYYNTIYEPYCTIGGGYSNLVSNETGDIGYQTIGGGYNNETGAIGATVAGGGNNEATGQYSLAAGYNCNASGNRSVAIGQNNDAEGTYSVALGYDANPRGRRCSPCPS